MHPDIVVPVCRIYQYVRVLLADRIVFLVRVAAGGTRMGWGQQSTAVCSLIFDGDPTMILLVLLCLCVWRVFIAALISWHGSRTYFGSVGVMQYCYQCSVSLTCDFRFYEYLFVLLPVFFSKRLVVSLARFVVLMSFSLSLPRVYLEQSIDQPWGTAAAAFVGSSLPCYVHYCEAIRWYLVTWRFCNVALPTSLHNIAAKNFASFSIKIV